MFPVVFILFATVLVVLQSSLFALGPAWTFAPDLYYLVIVYLACRGSVLSSLLILFFLGYVLDVISSTFLGFHSIFCYSAYFLVWYAQEKMPLNEEMHLLPLIGGSYVLVNWLVWIGFHCIEPGMLAPWSWWKMGVRTALLLLFARPLYTLIGRLHMRIKNKQLFFGRSSKGKRRAPNTYR